jgi:hypothetical protein
MKQHEMVHINAPVVARLTPEGLSRLEAYYNDLGVPYPPPWLHGDELCTQLWDVMHIFGPQMFMGNTKDMFVDNKLRIQVGEL